MAKKDILNLVQNPVPSPTEGMQTDIQDINNNKLFNYRGNIDINNRPVVENEDGSISTVKSKSFNFDGKEVLLPSISDDGNYLSDNEIIDQYRKSGKHLGIFSTPEEADIYANELHKQQEKLYVGKPITRSYKNISPIQQEYQEWSKTNPNAGFNDFLYKRNNPQPKAPNEDAIRKAQGVSMATDILSLIGQGITAGKGGIVNANNPIVSDATNKKAQSLIDTYKAEQAKWRDGSNVALNRDVAMMQKRQEIQAQREFDKAKRLEAKQDAIDMENIRSKNRIAESNDKQLFTAEQWAAKQKAEELKAKNAAKLRKELFDKAESGRNTRFTKSEEGKDRRYGKKPSTSTTSNGSLLPGIKSTTTKPKLLP